MEPLLLGPGEGERISDAPERFLAIKAGLEEIAVTESRYAQGERGPDAHIHREHVDAFYVVEGEVAFELGADAEDHRAPAGTFVAVPPGVVHSFRNDGPPDARYVNIHAPARAFTTTCAGCATPPPTRSARWS